MCTCLRQGRALCELPSPGEPAEVRVAGLEGNVKVSESAPGNSLSVCRVTSRTDVVTPSCLNTSEDRASTHFEGVHSCLNDSY